MIDLNTRVGLESGWVLVCALDINQRGQIVAVARQEPVAESGSRQRAYLLTPAPAPAPLAMLVLGSAVTAAGMVMERLIRTSAHFLPGGR